MRVGCPIAFANLASRSCSGVISNFAISVFCLLFAKLQTFVGMAKFLKKNSKRSLSGMRRKSVNFAGCLQYGCIVNAYENEKYKMCHE